MVMLHATIFDRYVYHGNKFIANIVVGIWSLFKVVQHFAATMLR